MAFRRTVLVGGSDLGGRRLGGEIGNLVPRGSILPHCVGGGDLGDRRGNREYLGLAFCRTV